MSDRTWGTVPSGRLSIPAKSKGAVLALLSVGLMLQPMAAWAQRASENAVASADDAFGGTVGQESTGIYSETDIRGFSPQKAGNARIDGIYFDQVTNFTGRVRAGSVMRVGFAALDYPFPAPTGIVDYRFRTSGNKPVHSVNLSYTAYNGSIEEFDVQQPLIEDRLSFAGGFAHSYSRFVDGGKQQGLGFGIRPRLRFTGLEISPFWSYVPIWAYSTRPLVTATGAFLPPMAEPGKYLGQDWAKNKTNGFNYGVTTRAELGPNFSFRGGAFRSRLNKLRNFTEIFAVSDPGGLANHVLLADPRQDAFSDSWEGQFAWHRKEGNWQHRILFGARGRHRQTETGGSDTRNFGVTQFGVPDPEPKPDFNFASVNLGTIHQRHLMLGYFGRLEGVGQVNIGLQKAHYEASFRSILGKTSSSADPWLYNASIEFEPFERISFFAGYVRGLEDSGTAPENAANRNEQLQATVTRQIDGGVRFKYGHVQVLASVFQIKKPYFTFDAGNNFSALGSVRHRGLEFSISGTIRKRLQLIAGAVLMDPKVSGEAVTLGRSGKRPVGTPSNYLRIDANYRTDIFGGLTPTVSLVYTSKRAGSAQPFAALGGQQVMVPSHVTLDLGLRYHFTIGDMPVSVRATAANVFDAKAWKVIASNTYQMDERRRFMLTFLADF